MSTISDLKYFYDLKKSLKKVIIRQMKTNLNK